MKRYIGILLVLCLVLSGCSTWMDGSYVSTKPHQEQGGQTDTQIVSASSYTSLTRALRNMVRNGVESGLISVANYNQLIVARDMQNAAQEMMNSDPVGAYAVEDIRFELGTNAGQPAIAVDIRYLHDRTEILKIQSAGQMDDAELLIAQALNNCDSGLVLYIESYEERDFTQWVDDYADMNPEMVMEVPQVTATVYPETGVARVLELRFAYQNSRDTLRGMQAQVGALIEDAVDGVDREAGQNEQYGRIYAFLMEQFEEYQIETSLTPAHSLLLYGVGDYSAFANVYSAICRKAGLECIVVTGTRGGQPWSWNIICCDGVYYHLDLLKSNENGAFQTQTDEEMSGYVWDYSAYPACGVLPEPEPTDPTEETTPPEIG